MLSEELVVSSLNQAEMLMVSEKMQNIQWRVKYGRDVEFNENLLLKIYQFFHLQRTGYTSVRRAQVVFLRQSH
jgi:hypothetical protein